MKRAVIIIAVFLLGLATLGYPTFSNYLSEKNGSYVINEYEEQVEETDEAAIEAAWEEAKIYNETLSGIPAHDPFLEGSGMAMPDNYYEVLNISGVMAYVEIPEIDVYLPIYHGTSEEVLKKGIGHLEGSSLPIGGINTHTVLTGHTGLSNAKLFTDLRELEEGALFYIHVLDQVLAYRVDQIKVVEPNHTEDLKCVYGKDYATLLTCTPYGINSHRLLVRGERVEYNPEEEAAIQSQETLRESDRIVITAAVIASAVMLLLIIIVIVILKKKQRRQQLEMLKQSILIRYFANKEQNDSLNIDDNTHWEE